MNEFPQKLPQSAAPTAQAELETPLAAGAADLNHDPGNGHPPLSPDGLPLQQVIEAILFSTDSPLTAGKLAETVGLDSTKPVKAVIDALNQSYTDRAAAYRIEERAGGYQFLTLPQYGDYVARLMRKKDEGRLTPAALETLAIIAYKQPILRVDVEAIRGVACGEVIRTLMEHNLVKIVGRAEELGRPMLYGTTRYFLEVFGLGNLRDLPKSDALKDPAKA
jgi:segregation and condensation protein B